jgi:hypothetical protein
MGTVVNAGWLPVYRRLAPGAIIEEKRNRMDDWAAK